MIDHKDIHEAVVAIMHEVGYIQKQKSPNLNYSYAGEAALIAALRPVMIDHGVYCYVSKISSTRDTFTTGKGTPMNVAMAQGEVTFVHAPSGSSITVHALGEGMDTGDKAANKAATGQLKYALRQTFLIETGDDPDGHDSKQMERSTGKKEAPKQEVAIKAEAKADPDPVAGLRERHSKLWKEANAAKLLTKENVQTWSIKASDTDEVVAGKIEQILFALPKKAVA